MARMKLYKNTRLGATEVYPIYELTYSELTALTGFTMQYQNDQVGTDVNKYRQWYVVNNDVYKGIDGNIPRQEDQSGNIIPFWHRYRNEIDNKYYLEPDILSSFAAIEQGVRPDDWGTNPNYVTLNTTNSGTPNSRTVVIPQPVDITAQFDSSTSYYEDTKRTQLRMFFNEQGNSFSICKSSYYNYNRWCGTAYGVAAFPTWFSSTQSKAKYSFTNSQGTVFDGHYHIFENYALTAGLDWDYNWTYWNGATNCQLIFIHYVENGTTDFYGIAMIQMNNMTETAEPVGIKVVAWDAAWWGTSIISGGGGSGQWTHDGPTSYVQGGQGTFEAPSDNHGDSGGQSAKSIASDWSSKHSPFDQGYNKYLLSSPDAGAFKQMVDNLVDPDVWQGFDNKYYSPIDSIITCSMIPAYLAPSGTDIGASSVIKASKLNLTTSTVPTFNIWDKAIHIGNVDIRPYCDGFPDFDNTAIYINLPYVGVKQLDINACMEGELAVDYLIDYLTSDVTAQIWVRDKFGNYNIRYEFKGNCGKQIPLTQIVPRSTQVMQSVGSGLIGVATSLAGAAITGGVAGSIAKAAALPGAMKAAEQSVIATGGRAAPYLPGGKETIAAMAGIEASKAGKSAFWGSFAPSAALASSGAVSTMANGALQAGQQMMSSNANGGAVSSPVNTQCYLAIVRPMWSAPEDYGKRFGYPSDISGTINQSDTEAGDPFTNFLSVRAILLDGLTCLPEEKAEIEQLMSAGVYVSND